MWIVGDHPVIKLFGKTIPLPPNQEPSAATHQHHHHQILLSCTSEDQNSVLLGDDQNGDNQKPSKSELTNTTRGEEISSCPTAEDSIYPATSCGNSETQSVDRVTSTPKPGKNEEHTESSSSQEKTLKKPDKILPCPRCNSMDTKFCYYNNYNVNQPRYFCKKCQRYWTSGGTMRNVPVGSGRRKNKSSALHFRHLTVSEALHGAQADALKSNVNVLAFGSESDAPLFQSMASAINPADNGLLRPEQRMSSSCGGNKNGDDNSIGSSITASISIEKGGNAGLQETIPKHFKTFPPQVPCFQEPPWACPWNNAAQWTPPALIRAPGYPLPFHLSSPYWGCTPTAASWNMPWLPPQPSSPSSIPSSPTLGKHSRDGDMLKLSDSEKGGTLKESNSENCIWVPKTLRIDDPSEAAKSSIWSTLGIKNERSNSIYGGGLFKGFQSKGYDKNLVAETSPVLQANPAALSRSLNFHEST